MSTWLSTAKSEYARFYSKVVPQPNGCWLWTGSCGDGYGHFTSHRKLLCAHRFSYEKWYGPIPEGLELDHLCRNRSCVFPDHLEPVTHPVNVRRAAEARTHCRKGHLFDRPPGRMGVPRCSTCYEIKESRKRTKRRVGER